MIRYESRRRVFLHFRILLRRRNVFLTFFRYVLWPHNSLSDLFFAFFACPCVKNILQTRSFYIRRESKGQPIRTSIPPSVTIRKLEPCRKCGVFILESICTIQMRLAWRYLYFWNKPNIYRDFRILSRAGHWEIGPFFSLHFTQGYVIFLRKKTKRKPYAHHRICPANCFDSLMRHFFYTKCQKNDEAKH